jgi:hypothetical protein
MTLNAPAGGPVFHCSQAGHDEGLMRTLLERAVRHSCTRPSDGRGIDIYQLLPSSPSTWLPVVLSSLRDCSITNATDALFAGVARYHTSNSLSLLVADFSFHHIQHLGLPERNAKRHWRQVRAHYDALRELAHQLDAALPVLLLCFGDEAADVSVLRAAAEILRSCHLNPAATVMLHYNVGTMLPLAHNFLLSADARYLQRWQPLANWANASLRQAPAHLGLHQAFLNDYLHAVVEKAEHSREERAFVQRFELCRGVGAPRLKARLWERLRSSPSVPLLIPGGRPKFDRAVLMLELQRRGLLEQSRFSAGLFRYCADDQNVRLSRAGLEKSTASTEMMRNSDSFALGPAASLRLLRNASLVWAVCQQLPSVLDVDATHKASAAVFDAAHDLWRKAGLGLIFETNMRDHFTDDGEPLASQRSPSKFDRASSVLYVTEKVLKPMLNLRPFVVLGPAASLAQLRALGFRSFAPIVDETYDTMPDRSQRVRAALSEVQRLLRRPPSHWATSELVDTLTYNVQHLLCGGLRRELRAHAVQGLALAELVAAKRNRLLAGGKQPSRATNNTMHGGTARKMHARRA